jgi:hypothetical protein
MTKREIPDNAIVRLIDLPPGIGGAVMEDENGFISIYINARHGHYAQLDDLDHELAHIEHDDIHNSDPIEVIESRADAHATPRHLPKLFKASDLIPPSQSLPQAAKPPVQGKVAAALPLTEEVVPSSHIPRSAPQLSPHQAAVLLRAISDLDDWLFRDTTYDF